ncbi:MAG: GNAT family N-acetyltransferase [Acidobacteriia bacterium]|nr:GNAT family N-acetyltransferase [Terriglobia bacterium]
MSISYRAAQPSDAESILRLMRAFQVEDPWSVPFDEPEVRRSLQVLLEDPGVGSAWLICDAGRPIGYIFLCFDYSVEFGGKGAWVDEFFVQAPYRGKGIGGEALRLAEELARQSGACALHLQVSRGNPAIHLYRRSGFQAHQRDVMTKWLR